MPDAQLADITAESGVQGMGKNGLGIIKESRARYLGRSLDGGKIEVGSNDVGVCIEGRDVVTELRQVVFLDILVDCVQLDSKGVDISLRRGRPRLPEETPGCDNGFARRSDDWLRGEPV